MCCALWGLLSPPPTVRWERKGGGGAVAPGGVGDLAASSSTGVAVAESSRSQKSLVLAAPSSVASSVSGERDRRSRSRRIGESTEARSCFRSSRSSSSRGRESHEGRRCARLRSMGWRGGSRRSRLLSSDRCRDRQVRSHSRSDHSWSRQVSSRLSGRREARCDRSRSHGSHYRSRDC